MNDKRKCEMCLNYFNEIKPVKAPEDFITLINKGEIIICKACIKVVNEYKDLQR